MKRYFLGWSRDNKGVVKKRIPKSICNTITTFCGEGYGTAQPFIIIYKDRK